MEVSERSSIERYIALDIHKEYVLAGGMNARQAWVMQPRKIEMGKFREWAASNLCAGDAVVIETTTNVWDIYDIVSPLATRRVVAHAGAVRQIAEARVKTDKKDIERLIRLLIADIVPMIAISMPLRKGLPTVTRALYTPTLNKVKAAVTITIQILRFTLKKKNGKSGMSEPASAENPTRMAELNASEVAAATPKMTPSVFTKPSCPPKITSASRNSP